MVSFRHEQNTDKVSPCLSNHISSIRIKRTGILQALKAVLAYALIIQRMQLYVGLKPGSQRFSLQKRTGVHVT